MIPSDLCRYLSPKHQVQETIFLSSLYALLWFVTLKLVRVKEVALSKGSGEKYTFHFVDWILGLGTFGAWAWCIICKSFDGRLLFVIVS